eukprot:870852_1
MAKFSVLVFFMYPTDWFQNFNFKDYCFPPLPRFYQLFNPFVTPSSFSVFLLSLYTFNASLRFMTSFPDLSAISFACAKNSSTTSCDSSSASTNALEKYRSPKPAVSPPILILGMPLDFLQSLLSLSE